MDSNVKVIKIRMASLKFSKRVPKTLKHLSERNQIYAKTYLISLTLVGSRAQSLSFYAGERRDSSGRNFSRKSC